jgi:hypothetical protein
MGARIRCSNCEKSVSHREKNGRTFDVKSCKATGEKITGAIFYIPRKCREFLPRKEYVDQFSNPIDRAVELIETGKQVKDILDPL